ncbi:MAG: nitronate monooxygenase [Verrucomicrobiales bacterium]
MSSCASFLPQIIQGGMGVAVSQWLLAKAVSQAGQLGVVSGTALDVVLARRLQDGDPQGHLRRAIAAFPIPEVSSHVLKMYWVENGRPKGDSYRPVPMHSHQSPKQLIELTVLANFVEVYLAKEGHTNPVGINYLEKIQLPTLPSIYGALLAGVDVLLMGAGIPRGIPAILDALTQHQPISLALHVAGATRVHSMDFDPRQLGGSSAPLRRPAFLPIVSSSTLAAALLKKSIGPIDGFVVEDSTAGGHNAPPRNTGVFNEAGEPVYGERDRPDLTKFCQFDLPFWLAGSRGAPGELQKALELGAAGIQVGTAFAFCQESGIRDDIKQQVLELAMRGRVPVRTDPLASPTGFPLKILGLAGTRGDRTQACPSARRCDLGYLRQAFEKPNGQIGFRCPSELPAHFLDKGGDPGTQNGRLCVCNGLLATAGFAQLREKEGEEMPLVTAGDAAQDLANFLQPGKTSYSAAEVIALLLSNRSA